MLTNKNPSYEHEPEHVGTVSHGTMRPEDLAATFFEYLSTHAPDTKLTIHQMSIIWALEDGGLDLDPEHYEEDVPEVMEVLFDAMNDLADEGYYFGAHPGDGSDFGFWEVEDD